MNPDWVSIVQNIATVFGPTPNEGEVKYLIVGSVASVLQNCNFEPNDLDITFPDRENLNRGIHRLSTNMMLKETDEINTESFGDFRWHISRSHLAETKCDLVYIERGGAIPDSDSGEGIWEGGKLIWHRHNIVRVGEHDIPVAPLPIQFESQVRRQHIDRAIEIKRVLNQVGYNIAEVKQSLSQTSLEIFYKI